MKLVPGQNCWRVETAARVGLCVDGECYFRRLRQSLIAARRCIAIAAWDIHSRLELVRPDPEDGWPSALGDLLTRLLERRPELEIFVLLWDYAPIYALEREPLSFGEVPWHKDAGQRHPRLHFILDDQHPLLASQHQKLVLIDGALAWCGGFDISKWRWDTEAHRADEPRRRDPDGDPYPPFHDLQLLVDGEAARALGELFAERWARAGGGVPSVLQAQGANRSVDTGAEARSDPWPETLAPLLYEQPIGIARTLPEFADQAEVREVERLYLDMIASARMLIYIENQYLTSRAVADALRHSLSQPDGPHVLIILPRETGHWLEQHTMDLIRARLLSDLRDSDRYGRLHSLYPDLPALGDRCLMVHAKLMIVDDRVLRLGSSNLSNRSMGLDSECDLCLIGENETARTQIRHLRRRLLGMFLTRSPEEVARIEQEAGVEQDAGDEDVRGERETRDEQAVGGDASGTGATESASAPWGRALARLLEDERQSPEPLDAETAHDERLRLRPLEPNLDPEWDRQLPDERLIDPDRALSPDWVGDVLVGDQHQPHVRWRLLLGIGLVLAFLVLAALWRWAPVGDWLEPQRLAEAARALSQAPWGMPLTLAAFVLASLVAVPVTLLILVTTLVFDPLPGALIALGGSTIAAVAGYGIGHYTGAKAAEKSLGGRFGDLRERLTKRGIFTVVTLRIVPVAPFAVLNLIAGAMRVRFRDYVLGTLMGMAPAVIAMALFSEGLLQLLGRADMRSLALLLAGGAVVGGLLWFGHRLLRQRG